MEANDVPDLSDEIIRRLAGDVDLDMISNGLFEQNSMYTDDPDTDNEPDDVIIVHMDIREPLRKLQQLIEVKLNLSLKGYEFWLQDAQELEPHKNLVDQCVKGEGLVQINVQIQTTNQRINIVDVLKPTDAALEAIAEEKKRVVSEKPPSESSMSDDDRATEDGTASPKPGKLSKPAFNWVRDPKFRKEQVRLKIPDDPMEWTVPQVKHWFQWAMNQFNLSNFSMNDWNISGKELCALTYKEFRQKLPQDPGNIFYTHVQLLKECKFVSVVHKELETGRKETSKALIADSDEDSNSTSQAEPKILRKTQKLKRTTSPVHSAPLPPMIMPQTNPNSVLNSNSNGQIQLWQFLLELLTDPDHTDVIQWVGTDGEFRLTNPEHVARLWGNKKNKPAMNYEKLSRALRYYYDGDMISKVSGKRFAYKFDCDLKLLIGYDAGELAKLVSEKSSNYEKSSRYEMNPKNRANGSHPENE